MTTATKNGLGILIALLTAWGSVTASATVASRKLDGKEDRAAHDADMARETNARLLQHVHDSAFSAVILDRVNDIACAQNPTRRYCR